jgi:hypothetical protein
VLLELCFLEEEEEEFDLPILTVQGPLYRKGPGYKMSFGCPATGFFVATILAWALLFPSFSLSAVLDKARFRIVAPYLYLKAELRCICAIPWISR